MPPQTSPVYPEAFTQTGQAAPPAPPQAPVYPETFTQTGQAAHPASPQAPVYPETFTQTGQAAPPAPPQAPAYPGTFTQTGQAAPPVPPQAPAYPGIFTQTGQAAPPAPPQAPAYPGTFTQTGQAAPPAPPQAPAYPGTFTQTDQAAPPAPPQAPVYPETFTQTDQAAPPAPPQAPVYPGTFTQTGQAAPPAPPQAPVLPSEPYPDKATQVQQNLLHSIQSDISTSSSFTLPTDVPAAVLTKPSQQETLVGQQPSLQKEDVLVSSPKVQVQVKEETSDKQATGSKSYRRKRTFVNNSHVRDINERIHPENGSVVKVIVTWNDKILNTLYFDSNSTVRVGNHSKNDIVLPIFSHSKDSHSLIKISKLASLFVTYDMKGVLVKGSERITFDDIINSGAASRQDTGFNINLQRGELARVDFDSGVSIFVKYTVPSPKPLIGPFFDFTSAELNTIIMAIGSSIIMAIFFLIAHEPEVVELEEEVERKAIFVYKPPSAPAIDPIPVKPTPPKPIKVRPKKVKKLANKPKAPAQRAKTVTRQKRLNNKKQE